MLGTEYEDNALSPSGPDFAKEAATLSLLLVARDGLRALYSVSCRPPNHAARDAAQQLIDRAKVRLPRSAKALSMVAAQAPVNRKSQTQRQTLKLSHSGVEAGDLVPVLSSLHHHRRGRIASSSAALGIVRQ